MKILMFGWEFPPHISGGLGTACYGLTKALLESKTQVLFVVPKVFGSASNNEGYLINASKIASDKQRYKHVTAAGRKPGSHRYTSKQIFKSSPRDHITVLEIPSALLPYNQSLTQRRIEGRTLTAWNYALGFESRLTDGNNIDMNQSTIENLPASTGTDGSIAFSGAYGPDLMREVEQYAEVAAIIARQHPFDVIHVHDWMTFPAGISAKRLSGKPLVVHVHSTEFDRAGDHINENIFAIEKQGFAEADKIIAVSNWTKQILISRYQLEEGKIVVVHNGIVPKGPQEDFSFPDIGSHFVTFLGRVTHQKGPGFFVEAAQKVQQEFPDAHFIVAGAGDLLPQIIERVAQLNMSANFHFTGFLSPHQVDRVWSLTDVYVMPSVSEPFGIAPLEAIQRGVPVIMSKQSGVSEVMPHAIKVDFWDVQALASSICSVLRYESLSHVLRQNSKKHIEHLTWEKAAMDVKAVYHDLTGK